MKSNLTEKSLLKEMKAEQIKNPNKILSYFKCETGVLAIITVTGLLYNIGMVAGPYFEGQLIQRLFDIMHGTKTVQSMLILAVSYVLVILLVQGMRMFKRFYVRRLANDTNRNMRHMLYNSLVFMNRRKLNQESAGVMMTKAVSDVDACVEGMRKFTTEVFDTGVVLIAYLVMLFYYDFRLALLCCIFPPIAYFLAERLKVIVYRYTKSYKKTAERLNNATTDRISGALLYRIFGREQDRDLKYREVLHQYEHAAVKANVWENAMQPLYLVISSVSVIFILYFGSKNIVGTGWTSWNIASFTTFLSCFTKMATKSSKAAKLFNAVQKAQVSWKRIKPLMKDYQEVDETGIHQDVTPVQLEITQMSFAYPDAEELIHNLNLKTRTGQIVGVTGPVASGKSTLGKLLLCEYPYQGSIQVNGKELTDFTDAQRNSIITYLGHQPELISTSVEENISLGDSVDVYPYLKSVCLNEEVEAMEHKEHTEVGNSGMQLSGGQQARLALARTLCHGGNVLVLDDPFSAVDHTTEEQIMNELQTEYQDRLIILISHRLELFPQLDQVVWLDQGQTEVGTHEELMQRNHSYRNLYELQKGGMDYDAQ